MRLRGIQPRFNEWIEKPLSAAGRWLNFEGEKIPVYRISDEDDCYIPTALKRVLHRAYLAIIGQGVNRFRFPATAIFCSLVLINSEINPRYPANGGLAQNNIWLQSTKMSLGERLNWKSQNRNLIVATPDALSAALQQAAEEEVELPQIQ